MDRIAVFDFGSQTSQLIGRRVREVGVFSEIVPGDLDVDDFDTTDVSGIILSGSPYSVSESDAPKVDPRVLELGLPVLGICYGFHQMVRIYGGEVRTKPTREFGRARVTIRKNDVPLFESVPSGFLSWMSHGDSVETLPDSFETIGTSESFIAAAGMPEKRLFGIQFHPEVTHCEHGLDILRNFALSVCGAGAEWDVSHYLEDASGSLADRCSGRDVLLLISGGVDSSVVGALLLRALDPARVHLLYIDTGLMRKNETGEVAENLRRLGAKNLYIIDAGKRFLGNLRGVSDPEEKRRIIGDTFVSVFEEEIISRSIHDSLLAQGTLYTDMIESGKGVGAKAQVIKSHHNVRSPLIERKRESGDLLEPLSLLYKDEVRELGRLLGLDESVVGRHPFPGPGLAIRIIGEVSRERCEMLREADWLYIDQLKRRGLYDKIWQAFSVLLPVQTVGVTGDSRNYGYVLALRAITSKDGMSADVYQFEMSDILEISSLITNTVSGVGRVVYDVSSKPPATIEWE